MWRTLQDAGFNIKTGNPQVVEIRTCPSAEALPWYTRILTRHRKYPLIYAYGDFAYADSQTVDVNKKEKT